MELSSYKDIEKIQGISANKARQIVWKLQIKATKIGGVSFFTPDQVHNIKTYKKPRRISKKVKKKVAIVEEYIRTGSARKTASNLRLQKQAINDVVKEWKENDSCVIVESKLNFCKNMPKNILKRGEKYSYLYTYKGERYWKGGFKTQDEALDALIKLKQEIGQK